MLRRKSGIKEAKKALVRRDINRYYKSSMKTAIRDVVENVESEDFKAKLALAISKIDKTAKKKIIHKKNAANKKSKLMKKVNKLIAATKK